jgi:hypothetical protein
VNGCLGNSPALCSRLVFAITALLVLLPSLCSAGVFFSEEFENLEDWKPVFFRGIDRHSEYRVEEEGDDTCLVAISNSSASALVFRKEFNVYEYPKVRWRWKISRVLPKGDARTREGDDYPIRLYITFRYDPEGASMGERVRYAIAKHLYGEYPPKSSLNYIWANRQHGGRILTSPYTGKSRLLVLRWGENLAGRWVHEDADIIRDYREAFGEEPPPVAGIAIMSDSDNTGGHAVSYIDSIEVYRE